MSPFRQRLTLHQRRSEYSKVRRQRPDHIPTIIEQGCRDAPLIDKEKFLIPPTLSGAQLSYVVRRRLQLQPNQALFLLCDHSLVHNQVNMGELHVQHGGEDGFLYIQYVIENTFG